MGAPRSVKRSSRASLRLPISARRRRLDDDRLRRHRSTVASQPCSRSMRPSLRRTQFSPTWPGSPPAKPNGGTRRWPDRMVHSIFSQEADGAADAVAGVPLALAAGVLADVEILEHARDSGIPGSSGSVSRVLVMWVCTASVPSKAGPGRRAGADRLVILVLGVAEVEIVHGALRRGERAERAEQAVGHRLRGLHIAGHHRGRIFRRQHRPFRDDDVDRPQAPGIHRDVVVDHHAEHVKHRGARRPARAR